MSFLVKNIRLGLISTSVKLKDIWLAYTSDKYDLHPLFAVLGVTRKYMKIVRGIFE